MPTFGSVTAAPTEVLPGETVALSVVGTLPGGGSVQNPPVNYQTAFPGYFQTMRIALTQGRLFTDRDDVRSPRVVVVNETTARQLWPGQSPLQRRILMPSQTPGDWSLASLERQIKAMTVSGQ